MEDYVEEDVFKARDFRVISIENERKALELLMSICLESLCKYPTMLKDDEEAL